MRCVAEDLLARAVAWVVLLALALAEERRELPGALLPLEHLDHVRAHFLAQEQLAGLVIGDVPEPVQGEDLFDALRAAVVPVEGVGVRLLVIGAEVDVAAVVADELEARPDARLVMDDLERA